MLTSLFYGVSTVALIRKILIIGLASLVTSLVLLGCTANDSRDQDGDVTGATAATGSTMPPSEHYGLARIEQTLLPPPAFIQADPPSSRIRLDIPIPINVNYTPTNSGQWESLDDTRQLWRLRLYTVAGVEMKFHFNPFTLPPDAELWLVPASGFDKIGPITNAQIKDNRYWSRTINHHDVTLELLMPLKLSELAFNDPSLAELTVTTIKVY